MLQVCHGSSRRASTSSNLSHADSFHSLPPSSHEANDTELPVALSLPSQSGANADATTSCAYTRRNGTQPLSTSLTCTSPTTKQVGEHDEHGDELDLTAADMERKDSKFTAESSSSSTHRRSSKHCNGMTPPASRRPSHSRHSTSFSQTQRPRLGSRRQTQEEIYAAHARACAIFPNSRKTSRPSSQVWSAPTSQASLPRSTPLPVLSPRASIDRERSITAPSQNASYASTLKSRTSISNHDEYLKSRAQSAAPTQAPAVIDWMDPATRKRTYEKYDRDRKGVRGLWRKITPDCFWRGSRVEFYDANQDDDDAKSIRRHRLDLDDAMNDDKENRSAEEERKPMQFKARPKKSWKCFGDAKQNR